MCTDRPCRPQQTGFSLVEVILFIMVVSIALVVVLQAFSLANAGSADPVLRRQSLAIAQALLEEISYKPVTDPGGGSPANRAQFDHVDDYDGYTLSGIRSLDGTALSGLGSYQVSISVAQAAFGNVPLADGRRITVTVTDPAGRQLAMDAYRATY